MEKRLCAFLRSIANLGVVLLLSPGSLARRGGGGGSSQVAYLLLSRNPRYNARRSGYSALCATIILKASYGRVTFLVRTLAARYCVTNATVTLLKYALNP